MPLDFTSLNFRMLLVITGCIGPIFIAVLPVEPFVLRVVSFATGTFNFVNQFVNSESSTCSLQSTTMPVHG